MEQLIQFITDHASHGHWVIFIALLLAGCNIPISIDVVMILSAVLASSFAQENAPWLFGSVLFGCIFSAWISYFIGRFAGDKLSSTPLFSKLLHPSKLEKMQNFYAKYGIWTFIIGRFIPFGVRNCIFMTSGMSKMPFKTFAIRDAIGCTLWVSSCFTLFYFVGQNFIGNKKITKEEKHEIQKKNPGKSVSWFKNEERNIRKQRTINFVNINYDKQLDDDDVADACAIGHWALKNWDKAFGY
jgi:membrane protein DedA with SNARE-associated domain